MTPLTGKIAVVTGAGRGMGRVIALRLAEDGAKIVVNFARSEAGARAVVDEIEDRGGAAIALCADVAKRSDVRSMFEEIDRIYGRIDIVVNSAGVAHTVFLDDLNEAAISEMIGVNLLGPVHVAAEAAGRLPRGGRLINISSSVSKFPVAGASVYAGIKAGVRTMSEAWAKELGPKGITVNSILPGATSPGMMDASPEHLTFFENASPFGRIGQADEIASVVVFLCSDGASWVSGAEILVNGAANI